jgi:hypothetical protein
MPRQSWTVLGRYTEGLILGASLVAIVAAAALMIVIAWVLQFASVGILSP